MTFEAGQEYKAPGGYYTIVGVDGETVHFHALDSHRASAGGVFAMDAEKLSKLVEGISMTDERKMELIRREPEMLPGELRTLSADERAFIEAKWDEISGHDRDLFYKVWSEKPRTLEHAAVTAGCTADEIRTAAKVLRAIWTAWRASGISKREMDGTEATQLLSVIDWRARTCR